MLALAYFTFKGVRRTGLIPVEVDSNFSYWAKDPRWHQALEWDPLTKAEKKKNMRREKALYVSCNIHFSKLIRESQRMSLSIGQNIYQIMENLSNLYQCYSILWRLLQCSTHCLIPDRLFWLMQFGITQDNRDRVVFWPSMWLKGIFFLFFNFSIIYGMVKYIDLNFKVPWVLTNVCTHVTYTLIEVRSLWDNRTYVLLYWSLP